MQSLMSLVKHVSQKLPDVQLIIGVCNYVHHGYFESWERYPLTQKKLDRNVEVSQLDYFTAIKHAMGKAFHKRKLLIMYSQCLTTRKAKFRINHVIG